MFVPLLSTITFKYQVSHTTLRNNSYKKFNYLYHCVKMDPKHVEFT